jgi:hypothetical protein
MPPYTLEDKKQMLMKMINNKKAEKSSSTPSNIEKDADESQPISAQP